MIERVAYPERFFQFWSYTVSWQRLILRSTKSSGVPTRIDINFLSVDAIKISSTFQGLVVRSPTKSESNDIESDAGFVETDGIHNFYFLESGSGWGYVIAAGMVIREDEGEYYDESAPIL